jgi:CRP/FNR family transcriptional regulator, anaerobic regulatory protein
MSESDGDPPPTAGVTGPSLSAIPFHQASDGKITRLLSDRERDLLARIALTVRFGRGETIFRAAEPAAFVYNIASGIARTYRTLPDGSRSVVAFLFPDDLIGLAEEGAYVNSAEAVTPITAYRLPVPALENLLSRDATLEWHVLVKLCHELREVQHHAIILGQRGALPRLALFLQMLDRAREARDGHDEIDLPMNRSDIADYIGLSLAALSRAFRALADRRLIAFRDRRHLTILAPSRLAALVAERRRD